jgi:hypothetical protein
MIFSLVGFAVFVVEEPEGLLLLMTSIDDSNSYRSHVFVFNIKYALLSLTTISIPPSCVNKYETSQKPLGRSIGLRQRGLLGAVLSQLRQMSLVNSP